MSFVSIKVIFSFWILLGMNGSLIILFDEGTSYYEGKKFRELLIFIPLSFQKF